MAADPGCPDACGLTADMLLSFDLDYDGVISGMDLLESDFFRTWLMPDVDLYASTEDGDVFWPRHDEVKDHSSFAFELHAVPVSVAGP